MIRYCESLFIRKSLVWAGYPCFLVTMFDLILILLVIMVIIMSTLELVRLSLSIPSVTYRKWIFGRASLLDQSSADNDNSEDGTDHDDHVHDGGADHDDHVHDEDGGEDGVDDLCMRPTGRQGITVPKAVGK